MTLKEGRRYVENRRGQRYLPGVEPTRKEQIPQPSEFEISVAFADWLRVNLSDDVVWTHFPAGELRGGSAGSRLQRMGLRPGIMDYLLFWPEGLQLIELKRPGGRLSEAQTATIEALKASGYRVDVCYGYDEAVAAVHSGGSAN